MKEPDQAARGLATRLTGIGTSALAVLGLLGLSEDLVRFRDFFSGFLDRLAEARRWLFDWLPFDVSDGLQNYLIVHVALTLFVARLFLATSSLAREAASNPASYKGWGAQLEQSYLRILRTRAAVFRILVVALLVLLIPVILVIGSRSPVYSYGEATTLRLLAITYGSMFIVGGLGVAFGIRGGIGAVTRWLFTYSAYTSLGFLALIILFGEIRDFAAILFG